MIGMKDKTADTFITAELGRLEEYLPEWSSLYPAFLARFSPSFHGDQSRWLSAINDLLVNGCSEAALRKLMPWRKGPWSFGDLTIDTEWRSDWKWARLQPHLSPLSGKRVLDVGCGNGYFGDQILAAGAQVVVGIDPTLLYCMQHLAVATIKGSANNWVLPLTLEETPRQACFGTVLSMGVIYHRRDPLDHMHRLFDCTLSGGEVVLESLIMTGDQNLFPPDRYARMRNIHVIPTTIQMIDWLQQVGYANARVVDITPTSLGEQRSTDWMRFESLQEALDPQDPTRTVEGHQAPVRAMVIAQKP